MADVENKLKSVAPEHETVRNHRKGRQGQTSSAQLSCLPGTCSHAFTEAGGAAGLDEGKAGEHIGMVGLALLAQNEQVSF